MTAGVLLDHLGMGQLSQGVRSAVRYFAFAVANGTVEVALLDGIEYRPHLVEFGSELEMVFAIFANVLEVDEAGQVTNADQAQRRAAQWIRSYCDPDYRVDPAFEDWETELV